jgi:HSP20 family protein
MFGLVPWKKEHNGNRGLERRDRGAAEPFGLLRREFDTLFDRFFADWPGFGDSGWGFELEDAGKELVVRADAPGFEPDDFDVQLSGDVLRVRAERKQESKEEGERYRRFERAVTLPGGVDPAKVEAHYRNGVLELRLAKTPEAVGRRIEVKS